MCSIFLVQNWMESKKLSHLGVPRYIASGSFENAGTKYRFMIIDRFGKDLEKLYLQSKKKFSLPTVFTLGLRIVSLMFYSEQSILLFALLVVWHLQTLPIILVL